MMNDELTGDQLEQPRHEMVRVPPANGTTSSERADEWYCPTCERRMILEYPPRYRKIVLAEGNLSVSHSGGKGGLEVNPSQVMEINPRLSTWQEWMDSIDFERRWDDHS